MFQQLSSIDRASVLVLIKFAYEQFETINTWWDIQSLLMILQNGIQKYTESLLSKLGYKSQAFASDL